MEKDVYDFKLNPEKYGYREFKVDTLHENARHAWQKRIDSPSTQDKMYFITIYEYLINFHGESIVSYEADTQLYQKGTHCPVNLQFFDGWDIESIEGTIFNIYNNGDFEPYEENESIL